MLEKCIDWIILNTIIDQGIVISSQQKVSYPEVTGYCIPTLLSVGEVELAKQYGRWLSTVQKDDGSFGGAGDGRSYAFDTGQVVRGWNKLLSLVPELERPMRSACDWLIQSADPENGRLVVPPAGADWNMGKRGEVNEGIHLYVLGPLKEAGEILNEPSYIEFADKSLNYYLKYIDLTNFEQPNSLTHFYAYIQEALLELKCFEEAKKGMESVKKFQQRNGAVPAYSDVVWVCSTGLAQLAMVWYRLGMDEPAESAMTFLSLLQNPSGGFFGSYGVGADYFPAEEISWATKYVIEAMQLQIAGHFNQTINDYQGEIAETDGRVQAVLKHLGDLNGKKVLDAGCGKGRYSAIIKNQYPQSEITAIDISKEMLKYVQPGIRTIESGILDMPFENEKFDAVICIEALEHVVQIEKGIKELSRVLAPGGRLIVIDKNKDKLGALEMPNWEKWFSPSELVDIMHTHCLQVTHEFITYDQHPTSDELFVCWCGYKNRKKLFKGLICKQ